MSWPVDWAIDEKVDFDGVNKTITVQSDVSSVNVRADIYSSWKRWLQIGDNAKYLPALRGIGGDPVGGGLYTGDMYFLINGWQIVIDHMVSVNGVLYHDDGLNPFVVLPAGGVISTVSSLAYAYETTAAPSISDTDVGRISGAVWDRPVASHSTTGSFGEFVAKKLLTVAKFIGLK